MNAEAEKPRPSGRGAVTREDAAILAAIVRRKIRLQGESMTAPPERRAALRADVAVCEGLLRKFEAAIRGRQGEEDRPPLGARLH